MFSLVRSVSVRSRSFSIRMWSMGRRLTTMLTGSPLLMLGLPCVSCRSYSPFHMQLAMAYCSAPMAFALDRRRLEAGVAHPFAQHVEEDTTGERVLHQLRSFSTPRHVSCQQALPTVPAGGLLGVPVPHRIAGRPAPATVTACALCRESHDHGGRASPPCTCWYQTAAWLAAARSSPGLLRSCHTHLKQCLMFCQTSSSGVLLYSRQTRYQPRPSSHFFPLSCLTFFLAAPRGCLPSARGELCAV